MTLKYYIFEIYWIIFGTWLYVKTVQTWIFLWSAFTGICTLFTLWVFCLFFVSWYLSLLIFALFLTKTMIFALVSQIKIYTSKINPLSANFTKWSNTLKQFVGKYSTNCLSMFDRFVGLALKGLSLHIGDTFGGISVPN